MVQIFLEQNNSKVMEKTYFELNNQPQNIYMTRWWQNLHSLVWDNDCLHFYR